MTVVKVVPDQVATYGRNATAHFGVIVNELQRLTTMIDEVQFEGASAAQFRTETNTLVTDFNTQIHQAMTGMINNVQTAVGGIQQSMQGVPVTMDVPAPTKVNESDTRTTEDVEMDTEALASLDVEGPFGLISDAFEQNRTDLVDKVTWLGNQGDAARDAVIGLTTSATGVCGTYSEALRKVITAQVTATEQADTVTSA